AHLEQHRLLSERLFQRSQPPRHRTAQPIGRPARHRRRMGAHLVHRPAVAPDAEPRARRHSVNGTAAVRPGRASQPIGCAGAAPGPPGGTLGRETGGNWPESAASFTSRPPMIRNADTATRPPAKFSANGFQASFQYIIRKTNPANGTKKTSKPQTAPS